MSRPTATLVRDGVDLPLMRVSDARLYRLSEPFKAFEDDPGTDHVIVWSHYVDNGESNPAGGPQYEVEIYRADGDGVTSYEPMAPTLVGSARHADALERVGYESVSA